MILAAPLIGRLLSRLWFGGGLPGRIWVLPQVEFVGIGQVHSGIGPKIYWGSVTYAIDV